MLKVIYTTTLTIRFGTTITFLGAFPSSHFFASSLPKTASSMAFLSREADNSRVNLTFPLKEIGFQKGLLD